MSYDLCGLGPRPPLGRYFGNNGHWWHHLWSYETEKCSSILEVKQVKAGHNYDGVRISYGQAKAIALSLEGALASDHVKQRIKEFIQEYGEPQIVVFVICKGYGQIPSSDNVRSAVPLDFNSFLTNCYSTGTSGSFSDHRPQMKTRNGDMKMIKRFSTSDLALSAYLILSKVNLVDIVQIDGQMPVFVFEDAACVDELWTEFFNAQGNVEPLDYLYTIRDLKSLACQVKSYETFNEMKTREIQI